MQYLFQFQEGRRRPFLELLSSAEYLASDTTAEHMDSLIVLALSLCVTRYCCQSILTIAVWRFFVSLKDIK